MKYILILLSLAFTLSSYSQSFSGSIECKITIVPKYDLIELSDEIKAKEDEIATYIIKDGFYKTSYYRDKKFHYSYTYHDSTKLMYDDYADRAYITFRDSRKSNTKYQSPEVYKDSLEKVLDYDCYLVKSESESGKSKSYYSDAIRINPESFKGHQVGNWYDKLKEVQGAILLKSIWEYDDYIEIREAIKIEKRIVNNEEFDLPIEKQLIASYASLDVLPRMKPLSSKTSKCYNEKIKSASTKGGKKYVCYIWIVVNEKGEVKYPRPHVKDEYGFYKVALNMIKTCGFEFQIGKIDGEPVSTLTNIPFEFYK